MARHPTRVFDSLRLQTIGIIQAPDLQSSGPADMCDGCPDMTVWDGKLVNSCRMDEYRLFGDLLSVAEKSDMEAAPELTGSSDEDRVDRRK